MDWFRILFLCLMIIVQENNCNEVLNRFRREHQIDDCCKKNIKEKSVIIDQKNAKPDLLNQDKTTELEESNVTKLPPPAIKKNEKKVSKISNKKQEQRIKASIQKLPPSHPLSKAIKMIIEEKEEVKSVDDNKPYDDLKDKKVVENIVKSDNQGSKTRNPVKENKRDLKEELVKCSHNTKLLKNPSNDGDEKFEYDNLNVLTKDLEDKENNYQIIPKIRSLKQKEDKSDGLAKINKKDFQKKEEKSDTKIATTKDEKDKNTITQIEFECSNKPPGKDKAQNFEDLRRHDIDSKTSINCEDHEYEETYVEKPQHISDLPICETPYDGVMNWNQLPYDNIPKPYAGNYCTLNSGPFPYSNIIVKGGTILPSPNHYQQQLEHSFPSNNITPYKYTYNPCPAPNNFVNNFNTNDVIRRAWKNRVIHVDATGMKDQGAILNILAPRNMGRWQRPQVNDNGNTKNNFVKKIQETNGIINAAKHQAYIPSFLNLNQ